MDNLTTTLRAFIERLTEEKKMLVGLITNSSV
jgi:hypothetical protein